ncbi:MAG TPA: tRNA pseudouridine(38-40) synthase TruA [Steroidobacteraceae bacterium]|nr:tRNA pseudouridine(38-40) synthase TruA [Steroidobacteraceae bacterium]HQR49255.1 tRNA pseudouridine(38-40) synthase TruA [Steroidobacteraceae bacterium]
MARIAIGVEYDGSAYSGWQAQLHAPSVQGELERALSRVADHRIEVTAAGRTDAGVHALMQVAHFDTVAARPEQAWVLGGSAESAADVSVLWAREVPDDFHARFSALSRGYVYRIVNRKVRPALDRARACWVRRPLDADAMQAAAQCLLGEHDFSAFRAAECQSTTPVRRVTAVAVRRDADRVEMRIEANAFLHHMVRNVAGTLIRVGVGDEPTEWVDDVLRSRDRTRAGATAPPQGLYFAGVDYGTRFRLPSWLLALR